MSTPWGEFRRMLMTNVFGEFAPEDVDASTDLVGDGYLNSTSVLVVLGLLEDEAGEGAAAVVDSREIATMSSLQRLHHRLLTDGAA